MIIKGVFRRYQKWNPVHPTSGAFWGMGIGIGCGVGWGPGFGPEVVGYVGAGCGLGFSVGITFAGFGIGLPANVLIQGPYKVVAATSSHTWDLVRSRSFLAVKNDSGDEVDRNMALFPSQLWNLQQKANESLLKKGAELEQSISLCAKSISDGCIAFRNQFSDKEVKQRTSKPHSPQFYGSSRDIEAVFSSRNQRTFRPKKSAPSENKGAQLRQLIDATLGSGNLREAVRLPPGEDLNEWLAVNTVDFFNQVNLLYATLTEFCTGKSCPTMTAGPKYEYRWADGVQIKKPIVVSAPRYVDCLMDWVESQVDDESIFPQNYGTPFPTNFRDVVKTIFKRLFRVYAHIYHSHFQKIVSLKEEAHLNTCFKHFMLFTFEFGLIDKRELAPLQELIQSIMPY